MSEPIVFISHHRIKEGKLDGFKQFSPGVMEQIEASKPGTVAFLGYFNEDGTEVSFIHVFPDAEAMDLHVEGAGERSKKAYEFIEPQAFEIYGRPSDQVLEMMKQATGPGAALIVQPQLLGGYLRLKPG